MSNAALRSSSPSNVTVFSTLLLRRCRIVKPGAQLGKFAGGAQIYFSLLPSGMFIHFFGKYCIKHSRRGLWRGSVEGALPQELFSNCVFVSVHFGSIHTLPKCTNNQI